MKTLRHPPLLFWLAVCLLLAGTLLLLYGQGRDSDQNQPHSPAVADYTRSDADVETFRLRLAELPKLSTAQNETLRVWAEQFRCRRGPVGAPARKQPADSGTVRTRRSRSR